MERKHIKFTGGFPEGDYELIREGLKIGSVYLAEISPCGKKACLIGEYSGCMVYIEDNAVLWNPDSL